MRLAPLFVVPLLALGLSACNPAPPPCGADHRGWVRAEVTSGPEAGAVAAVFMEWTTMGNKPGCYGTWAGNAHAYPMPPGNGCYNGDGFGGTQFTNVRNGQGVEGRTRCHYDNVILEVFIANYVPNGAMWSFCMEAADSVGIRCEHQHVT